MKTQERKTKAILYTRTATGEQAAVDNHSLRAQESSLVGYCETHNLEVVGLYSECAPGNTFDRTQFQALLEYIKTNVGSIDLLLVTTWHRFSRGFMNALGLIEELKKLGIEVRATEQPVDLDKPEGQLMMAFSQVAQQYDAQIRSMRTKIGIRAAKKQGRYCGVAPPGYNNSRDNKNQPLIVPSVHAKNIKYAFEQIEKGKARSEVKEELKDKGLDVTKLVLNRILSNPVYMGMIVVPASDEEPECLVVGQHEALISEEVFNAVQDILAVKKH